MFKRFFKSTNGRIIAISVLVALVGAGVIGIMMLINNNKNKSIVVTEVNGTVDVIGLKNSGQAKKGQRFLNGEDVTVKEDSGLTFCLYNDKYAYVDANTHFRLETDSSNKGTNTKIVLDKGSERNVLMSKLKDGDSYEVDTPNSTMSVRGTIFRITVYTGSDGYVYTFVEVESGVVRVKLKDFSGEYTGVERDFHSGESGIIRGNLSSSEFLLTEDGEESRILDYAELPGDAVERLVALLDEYKVKDKIDEPEDNVTELASADTGEEGGEDANKEEDKDKDSQETKNTESKDNNNTKETKETKDNKDNKNNKDSKDTKDNKDNKNNNNNNKDTAKDNNTPKDNNTNNNTDANNNTDTNNGGNSNSGNNNSQPSHTHTWKEVIEKEASCEETGSKHNECSCGEKTESVIIPAKGHTWVDKVNEDARIIYQECSVCGKTGSVRYIEEQPEPTPEPQPEPAPEPTPEPTPEPDPGNNEGETPTE